MAQLANQIYGGAFDSRLMRNIREDKGYPYSPGMQTFGLPADYPETFQSKMTALTAETVVTGGRMVVGSPDSLVGAVGDYTKVKDQLTGFGDITLVDVSGKPIAAPQ